MINTDKKASVIIKSKFIVSNNSDKKSFNEYINYIDREEAKNKIEFADYNNYMDDEMKTSSLFTEDDDSVSEQKKEEIKKAFKKAQDKGSVLWQDVVSFDNDWLEENGVYNKKTKYVDDKKLKDITRKSMKEMLDKNHIDNNAIWSGAIHHNTDNIHIHIATVELSPNNYRGKRKLKSLEKVKSNFINKIMDRSKEHENINSIIRKDIVHSKKENQTFNMFNRTFKKDFLSIYKALPENKRYWNYGYNNINHVKPKINELTKKYIDKYHKDDFEKLDKLLDKEVDNLKKVYGKGNNKRYDDYKKNKMDDLYKRMGNAFLQEMKEYDKKINKIEEKDIPKPMKNAKKNVAFKQVRYGLDRFIYSDIKSMKNQRAFEELQRKTEQEGRYQ
ncbi:MULTISPECIES: MobP2 family relaxase [Oceanobacillus]|uniref:MobP2 family relaxase n=1 Tax=Oceanobacillus TaxID=182709 RepID=UPI0009BB3730|nr:MobP2 family relaxase [Oceanobacillus timonensis]